MVNAHRYRGLGSWSNMAYTGFDRSPIGPLGLLLGYQGGIYYSRDTRAVCITYGILGWCTSLMGYRVDMYYSWDTVLICITHGIQGTYVLLMRYGVDFYYSWVMGYYVCLPLYESHEPIGAHSLSPSELRAYS